MKTQALVSSPSLARRRAAHVNASMWEAVRALAVVALLGVAALGGCVKTGETLVEQPLSQKLPRTGTVGVIVNAKPEWSVDADRMKEGLFNQLNEAGWKHGENPDYIFEVTFLSFEKGSGTARAFNVGGEAELYMHLELKTKEGKRLAKVAVTGNSKRSSTVTVGRYNTAWGDNLPARAVTAAIDQIMEYLKLHA